MTIEFDRRTLLQTGVIAGAVAASAASASAQHAPAKLSTHALDMYLGKQAAASASISPKRRAMSGN